MRTERFITKWFKGFATIFSILLIVSTCYAGDIVPNTFSTGETVSASKMNENFNALESAINESVSSFNTTIREEGSAKNETSWAVSGVVSSMCNVGEVLTGGLCSCRHDDFDSSNTNYGYYSNCTIGSNFVIGFCAVTIDMSVTYYYGPPITVQAVCMDKTTVGNSITNYSISEPINEEINLLEDVETAKNQMEEQALQYQEMLETLK